MALREVHFDPRRDMKLPGRSMQCGYSSATASYVPTVTPHCPDEPLLFLICLSIPECCHCRTSQRPVGNYSVSRSRAIGLIVLFLHLGI